MSSPSCESITDKWIGRTFIGRDIGGHSWNHSYSRFRQKKTRPSLHFAQISWVSQGDWLHIKPVHSHWLQQMSMIAWQTHCRFVDTSLYCDFGFIEKVQATLNRQSLSNFQKTSLILYHPTIVARSMYVDWSIALLWSQLLSNLNLAHDFALTSA
jgi:hypothetical protein